jgi:hypothetical protein
MLLISVGFEVLTAVVMKCSVLPDIMVCIFNTVPALIPPLWSNGQSFWLQMQRSGVRLPALPDFMRSSGSGTGSTQPREDN